MAISKIHNFAALTAAGATATSEVAKATNASFNLLVAAIGVNVVVRAEFSFDNGTTWSNCNAADTTITANGQYSIPVLDRNISLPLVRFNLVSISGGTPTVTARLRLVL